MTDDADDDGEATKYQIANKSDSQLIEIPIPLPRLAIFTRYVPLLDTTDSVSSQKQRLYLSAICNIAAGGVQTNEAGVLKVDIPN